MSFQAYIDNIQKKTGNSAEDWIRIAGERGLLENGTLKTTVKATEVTNWLKADYALGHGHAMAIVALLRGHKDE
jgi:hypothetical protein